GEVGETLDGIPLNGLFNGGVTNSASQRNATPFVTSLLSSVSVYRGVNDPQHTSLDSLGGSVAYHLIDPALTPSFFMRYNVGLGGDVFAQTGPTGLGGTRFAMALGSNYYRGFQSSVPDANRYAYINADVPIKGRNFLRLIYSYDHNVGYVPHDVPVNGIPGNSIADNGVGFQWPDTQTYSFNRADVNLALLDFGHGWSPNFTTRLTVFSYNTQYNRLSYSDPAYPYLPNQPFAPTFAQGYMNGTISGNAADFAFHRYINGDNRRGYILRATLLSSATNDVIAGLQYVHGYESSAEYWGPNVSFASQNTYNDAWYQPGIRDSTMTFLEDKFRWGKLLVNPGIRLNSVGTTSETPVVGYFYSTPFNVGNSYNFTEPSLGMRYAFNSGLVAFGGVGTSAKPPEIASYYNDVPDPVTGNVPPLVVQPETSTDVDFGVRGQSFGPQGLRWSLDAYNDRFLNTFSSAPAPYSYYIALGQTPAEATNSVTSNAITLTTNAGDATYRGVEASLDRIPIAHYKNGASLSGYANYSFNSAVYTSAFISASGASITSGTALPYVPLNLWNAGLVFRSKALTTQFGLRGVGPQQLFSNLTSAPSGTWLDPYVTLDGYVAWTPPALQNTTLTVSASNILDTTGLQYGYISNAFDPTTYPNGVFVGMPIPPAAVFMSISERVR
ncbi:MAG: TonB-dependent receptor, partial [Vulcanimicrobiaceae bacterium]